MRPGPYEHLQTDAVYDGLDALAEDAERRGIHMSTLATAWVLSHPSVTGIVCGPRRPAHLWPSVSAVDVRALGRRAAHRALGPLRVTTGAVPVQT